MKMKGLRLSSLYLLTLPCMRDIGKLVMIGGAMLLVVGFVLWLGGDRFKWLGHLPGDIRIKKPGFSFYMPITTMILISIVLSLILWVIRKMN